MEHQHNMTSEHMHGTTDPHAGHGAGAMDEVMDHSQMGHGVSFKWRTNATVLWDFWMIETEGQYAGSVVVIILMGLLRELLVFGRRRLRRRYNEYCEQERVRERLSRAPSSTGPAKEAAATENSGDEDVEDSLVSASDDGASDAGSAQAQEDARPKWYLHPQFVRFLDSALYALQVTMSYFLMFVAMTFNAGLFMAVVIGIGLGYYLLLSQFPSESRKPGSSFQEQDRKAQEEMGEDCCN